MSNNEYVLIALALHHFKNTSNSRASNGDPQPNCKSELQMWTLTGTAFVASAFVFAWERVKSI